MGIDTIRINDNGNEDEMEMIIKINGMEWNFILTQLVYAGIVHVRERLLITMLL